MANKFNRCFTPTSLWNELKKCDGRVVVIVAKKNQYDIDNVKVVGELS